MKLTEGKQDAQWRRRLRWGTPLIVTGAVLTFTIGFYGGAPQIAMVKGENEFFCTPDARFQLPGALKSKWDTQSALWITLGFGNFTFAQAKALDLVWDTLVGRGGQLLMIYWAYPLIRRSLLLAIRKYPVYWPMYASLAFERISIFGAWSLVREWPSSKQTTGNSESRDGPKASLTDSAEDRRIWKAWRRLFLLPLFLYLLAFPTLMSIMTGYQAGLIPYVKLRTGDLVPASVLDIPRVVALDGSRIGLSDELPSQAGDAWVQSLLDYETTWAKLDAHAIPNLVENATGIAVNGYMSDSLTRGCWVESKQDYSGSDCSFTARVRMEDNPSLYGSYTVYAVVESSIRVGDREWSLSENPLSIAVHGINSDNHEKWWSSGSEGLSSKYLTSTSKCQPTETYIWGFSFLMLFVACVWTIVFAATLAVLHYNTFRHSPADRFEQSVSMYQDILDVAAGIRGILRVDEDSLSAAELEKEVNQSIQTIQLKSVYDGSAMEEGKVKKQGYVAQRLISEN